MNSKKAFRLASVLIVCFIAASCNRSESASAPKITLSPEKVPDKGHVQVHGTGFTPRSNIKSHLRRPNNTEFPVLPIITDDKGEFTHDIDTLLMDVGTHELWVIDSTGVESNVAKFEVTKDQAPPR